MKASFIFILFAFLMIAFWGCHPETTLYRFDDNKRISIFKLNETSLTAVKKYLSNFSNKAIQDTIIIKYDYNNETCWNTLDNIKTEEEMKAKVLYIQTSYETLLSTRPGVSFFNFREPGENINKITKYNTSIIIDKDLELYKFFFKEKCRCGNSILILPDGRYIFTRSDSHTNALYYSAEQIKQLLHTKRG